MKFNISGIEWEAMLAKDPILDSEGNERVSAGHHRKLLILISHKAPQDVRFKALVREIVRAWMRTFGHPADGSPEALIKYISSVCLHMMKDIISQLDEFNILINPDAIEKTASNQRFTE